MQHAAIEPPVLFCGCGWLGRHYVLETANGNVIGTTQSAEKAKTLKALGVKVVPFTLGHNPSKLAEYASNRCAVLNIPVGRKQPANKAFAPAMVAIAKTLLSGGVKRLIFISTTSVYGAQQGRINEQSSTAPNTTSGEYHCVIEQQLLQLTDPRVTVIRLAGLVGPDRHPITFLSAKHLDKGEESVNLVHVKDVVNALHTLMQTPVESTFPSLLHLCSLTHPRRDEYYTWAAKQWQLTPPVFNAADHNGGKQIDAQQSWHALGLTPTFVSPFDMI